MTWQYHIEHWSSSERWSTKKQNREVEAFQERLNELGQAGWELVSYETIPITGSITGQQKGVTQLAFFKRQE